MRSAVAEPQPSQPRRPSSLPAVAWGVAAAWATSATAAAAACSAAGDLRPGALPLRWRGGGRCQRRGRGAGASPSVPSRPLRMPPMPALASACPEPWPPLEKQLVPNRDRVRNPAESESSGAFRAPERVLCVAGMEKPSGRVLREGVEGKYLDPHGSWTGAAAEAAEARAEAGRSCVARLSPGKILAASKGVMHQMRCGSDLGVITDIECT
jgi:hypothetical protein